MLSARQELVMRLDGYVEANQDLFREVRGGGQMRGRKGGKKSGGWGWSRGVCFGGGECAGPPGVLGVGLGPLGGCAHYLTKLMHCLRGRLITSREVGA